MNSLKVDLMTSMQPQSSIAVDLAAEINQDAHEFPSTPVLDTPIYSPSSSSLLQDVHRASFIRSSENSGSRLKAGFRRWRYEINESKRQISGKKGNDNFNALTTVFNYVCIAFRS